MSKTIPKQQLFLFCPICGKSLASKRKYCNQDCYQKSQKQNIVLNPGRFIKNDSRVKGKPKTEKSNKLRSLSLKKAIIVSCEICGTSIERIPAVIKACKHYFCSRRCYLEWHKSIYVGGYGNTFPKSLRTKIRERDGCKCQLCGKKERKGEKHAVHHIDYNKNNSGEVNLITLCISCHSKTNHDKEYWKKYFNKKGD